MSILNRNALKEQVEPKVSSKYNHIHGMILSYNVYNIIKSFNPDMANLEGLELRNAMTVKLNKIDEYISKSYLADLGCDLIKKLISTHFNMDSKHLYIRGYKGISVGSLVFTIWYILESGSKLAMYKVYMDNMKMG